MSSGLSCRAASFFLHRKFITAIFAAAVSASWFGANIASAQLTTQMLIGDAVSEVGSQYSDVDEAIKRFMNRDVVGARLLLDAAKRKHKEIPPTDLLMAKMYLLTDNAAAARASLEKTAMETGDPEPYLILGDQAAQQRRMIEAESLYDKALELTEQFSDNPKRKRNFEIRARTGRAFVAESRKNWPAVIADMQALLKADPDNATAHYRHGRALFMQKKFREGYDEFVAADKLDKNLPDPFVAAALTYDQLDMQQEAQQAFDRAMQANAKEENTLLAYGQWLIKRGQLEKAEQVLAEARKVAPQSLNVMIFSGVAAQMNNKMKPAEDYFMDALRIAPANGDVLNQLALLLIEQNEDEKRQRALQFAGISSRLNNQSADAQVTLAWVLYQLGRLGDANAALNNAFQLGNLTPDSNYLVAKMFAERNPDGAKQLLRDALAAETQGLFVNRREAEALLDTLNK
jgi:tetratricopeptide (TPR) repeat protein